MKKHYLIVMDPIGLSAYRSGWSYPVRCGREPNDPFKSGRELFARSALKLEDSFLDPTGLEPVTSSLQMRRSSQMSYGPARR